MAGPVSMALGPFPFVAHGFGYADLERTLSTPWAEIETVGRFNALQFTGPASEVVTITGVLFPREFGGMATLEGLRVAATSGLPLLLVSLGGLIFGRQVIEEITEARSHISRIGTPGKLEYSITLKRHDGGRSLTEFVGDQNWPKLT